MTLAPYHVPWALSACALALLGLGLAWMVFHGGTLRVMAVLKLSDGVALWLAFAGAYHAVRLIPDDHGAAGHDAPAVGVVWGVLAVYALLRLPRLLPTRLRGEAVLLAITLAAWGWTIGAGYQSMASMEEHAQALRSSPLEVLAGNPPRMAPLRQALALSRRDGLQRQRTEELSATLAAGRGLSPAAKAAARHVLLPELAAHYQRDLTLLRSYQILQIVLLAALLLAWGFGRRPA